ncbi:MAG: SGNH/GDSL hydrolase family protein [Eubacteriales bacterium]|nr:SGNH/GDSL hydrolase family protein [Eubacteriales bacterium]
MYRERSSGRKMTVTVCILLLTVLICAAVFVMFSRYKAHNAAQEAAEAPQQTEEEVRIEAEEEEVQAVIAEEEVPVIAGIPEEEPLSETEVTVVQPQEIIVESLPDIEPENSELSFYQKLKKGDSVNILIMGDATAMGYGASEAEESADGKDHRWFVQLSDYLAEKYLNGKAPYVNSIASEDASLIWDTLALKNNTDTTDYDLILLSYGSNELSKTGLDFEALLLTLRDQYPNASFITTLEPCMHALTTPMEFMRGISYEYGIPVVNLFGYFYDNSKNLNEYLKHFDVHQTFPGDQGQDEWFELLKTEIDKNVEESTGKMEDKPPIDPMAPQFAAMKFLSVNDPAVKRTDDLTYTVDARVNGLAYMVHKENIGDRDVKVIADGILYQFRHPNGILLDSGDYLTLIYAELISENSFSISFSSKEYADGLQGFYFYYPEE